MLITMAIIACSKSDSSSTASASGSVSESLASASGIWARSTTSAPNSSQFNGVAVDTSGNIYAVGYQTTNATFTYGSQNVTGNHTNQNAVIVKYDSTGAALWARSTSAGTGNSVFNSIAVDSSGNVYAAGYQQGTSTFTYGSQSITGTASGSSPILIKYDSSGTALWARTISAGATASIFWGVAVDGSSNVFVAGQQAGTGTYTYSGQSATGTYTNNNALIVKYDSSGAGIWARTVSAGPNISKFLAIAVDGSGNAYVTGSQTGTGTYTYGTQSIIASSASFNATLVKYDSSGSAIWARTTSAGTGGSQFNTASVDSSGNIYVGGYQSGNSTITYGGQGATGSSTSYNVVLVKYDSAGTASWAQTLSTGNDTSQFTSVTADNSGNVFAAGYQNGTGTFGYGGRNITGTSANNNLVLVKYSAAGTVTWAATVTGGTAGSTFNSVAVNSTGSVFAVGYQTGNSAYNYSGQSVTGAGSSSNSVLAKYQ